MKISLEGKILLIICTLDCALSALLFHFRLAFEANPIMALFLKYGLWHLVVIKMGASIALISGFELFKWKRPDKIQYITFCQRTAILFYLGLIAFAPQIYLILRELKWL